MKKRITETLVFMIYVYISLYFLKAYTYDSILE